MGCKTEDKIINGIKYSCTQYSAVEALTYKMKLMKILGPAISELIPLFKNKKPIDEFDEIDELDTPDDNESAEQIQALSNAVSKLFLNASPEEVTNLIKEMLTTGSVVRDGKRLTEPLFIESFTGDNLSDVYKVFIFVLKVNYGGFFKGQKANELLTKAENL